jgi:predicted DNA-binding transcriptional regulator YafY
MGRDSLGMVGWFLVSAAGSASVGEPHALARRFHFDADAWYWSEPGRSTTAEVVAAIRDDVTVEVDYRSGRSGANQTFEAEPYGLVWKGGSGYLVARTADGPLRSLRLDRMDRVARTERRFGFPDTFDLAAWWRHSLEEFGKGEIRVVLRGRGRGVERLRSMNLKSTSDIQDTGPGEVTVTLYVDDWQWLVPLAGQFGDQIEILGPLELRSAIVDHLARALRLYRPEETGPVVTSG